MRQTLHRLRNRKVVQWGLGYSAAAWVAIQGIDVLGGMFGVSESVGRAAALALFFGLPITVVLAWFHGERGHQRIGGIELLLLAAIFVAAGETIRRLPAESGSGSGDVRVPQGPAEAPDARSVAVLPFSDLSPEADQAYFGQGIAEELISVLSGIEGLRVSARTSSFALNREEMDVAEIGARLGVGRLVEGSVRKSGDRLRIEARLIDVADGFPVWSDRFDMGVADIFQIQDSIAVSVARAFAVTVEGEEGTIQGRGQTADHEAQDLYLKGRFAWNRRTQAGLEEAVAYFDRAVERDPEYARALSGLADAYAVLGFYDYRPPREAFPLAQAAALRAIAIDSTLAEPWATLAYAALYHDWDWSEAERLFSRSIALDPGYPTAHQWYGNYLTAMGRFAEAEEEMRTASELDPLSMIAFAAIGWVQLYSGDWVRAIELLEEAVLRDPSFELGYLWAGNAQEAGGNLEEAEALVRRAVELSGASGLTRPALARVLALRGRTAEARAILSELEGGVGYVPSYEIARAYVGLSDPENAVAWLRRAHSERSHSMAFLGVDPQLRALRGHPGFEDLLRELTPEDL